MLFVAASLRVCVCVRVATECATAVATLACVTSGVPNPAVVIVACVAVANVVVAVLCAAYL